MSSPSATPKRYPYQNEPIWSRSEKRIARTVFDAVLHRELHEVMQETKRMANQIANPADLWHLERYLTQRRKEMIANTSFVLRNSRASLGDSCANVE
jgi:hypothetical protein